MVHFTSAFYIRDSNLDEASFEQRFDMIARLAIEVYPTEDLKSMRVTCRLGLTGQTKPAARGRPRAEEGADSNSPTWCGKVMSAPPTHTVDATIFEMWLGNLSTHQGLSIPVA